MVSPKNIDHVKRIVLAFLALGAVAPVQAAPTPRAPALAAAQTAQSCVEDFASDADPTVPGFASTVFSHRITGNYSFFGGPSDYDLAMFAGSTDVVTFPGQTVTHVRVPFDSFSSGYIIYEGVGGTLTLLFRPGVSQSSEASETTLGDNELPLGQILKLTLIGFETVFDRIEISPCVTAPPAAAVEVLVRPRAINPKRNDGLIKAAILSDAGFDARSVDPATVGFGAATIPFTYFFGDEDGDGDTDLIFFFLVRDVGIQCGDTTIRLAGRTLSGQSIEGAGAIQTLGCP